MCTWNDKKFHTQHINSIGSSLSGLESANLENMSSLNVDCFMHRSLLKCSWCIKPSWELLWEMVYTWYNSAACSLLRPCIHYRTCIVIRNQQWVLMITREEKDMPWGAAAAGEEEWQGGSISCTIPLFSGRGRFVFQNVFFHISPHYSCALRSCVHTPCEHWCWLTESKMRSQVQPVSK